MEEEQSSTKNLTPASRTALAGVGLHFHDLRREAGSRWMDGGVPLATIQRWLGHSNIAQTGTYLSGTQASEHDAMRRYEEQQAALQGIATEAGGPEFESRHPDQPPYQSVPAGRVKHTRVPSPAALSAQIRPPCASMMHLAM